MSNIDANTVSLKYKVSEEEIGTSQGQITSLTNRISQLQGHFKNHKKDSHSRFGLLKLVSKRRKLLDYLKRRNISKYRSLISKLNLRR